MLRMLVLLNKLKHMAFYGSYMSLILIYKHFLWKLSSVYPMKINWYWSLPFWIEIYETYIKLFVSTSKNTEEKEKESSNSMTT